MKKFTFINKQYFIYNFHVLGILRTNTYWMLYKTWRAFSGEIMQVLNVLVDGSEILPFFKITISIGTVNRFSWNKTEKASLNFFLLFQAGQHGYMNLESGIIWTWRQQYSYTSIVKKIEKKKEYCYNKYWNSIIFLW